MKKSLSYVLWIVAFTLAACSSTKNAEEEDVTIAEQSLEQEEGEASDQNDDADWNEDSSTVAQDDEDAKNAVAQSIGDNDASTDRNGKNKTDGDSDTKQKDAKESDTKSDVKAMKSLAEYKEWALDLLSSKDKHVTEGQIAEYFSPRAVPRRDVSKVMSVINGMIPVIAPVTLGETVVETSGRVVIEVWPERTAPVPQRQPLHLNIAVDPSNPEKLILFNLTPSQQN